MLYTLLIYSICGFSKKFTPFATLVVKLFDLLRRWKYSSIISKTKGKKAKNKNTHFPSWFLKKSYPNFSLLSIISELSIKAIELNLRKSHLNRRKSLQKLLLLLQKLLLLLQKQSIRRIKMLQSYKLFSILL